MHASAAAENARQSDSFVDSFGINVHLTYTETAYGNYSGIVKPMLTTLGVRHIRDGLSTSSSSYEADYYDLASSGIKVKLLLNPTTAVSIAGTIPTALESVEGANETDTGGGFSYNGQGFPTGTRNFQMDLYNAITNNSPTSFCTRELVDQSISGLKLANALNPAIELNSIEDVLATVRQMGLVTLLPDAAVRWSNYPDLSKIFLEPKGLSFRRVGFLLVDSTGHPRRNPGDA